PRHHPDLPTSGHPRPPGHREGLMAQLAQSAPTTATVEGRLGAALKDAGMVALLAGGLFLPLIAFRTESNTRNELTFDTRWPLFFAMVAIIAGGRLAYNLFAAPWIASRVRAGPRRAVGLGLGARLLAWFAPFAIGFALAYPVLVLLAGGTQGALKWI